MTFTDDKNQLPKFIRVHKTQGTIPLIIHGQGVFVFDTTNVDKLNMFFLLDNEKNGLSVLFKKDGITVHKLPNLEVLLDTQNTKGLSNLEEAYYWFNLDAQNMLLSAGVGEARVETALYKYQFDKTAENKKFLESLTMVSIPEESSAVEPIRVLRDPITQKVPLLIKDKDELKMKHVAKARFLPQSFLSPSAQKLYDSIAGKKFKLNEPDFPDFSKAIEYSINTPGGWCNETLKSKAGTFSDDAHETYLRITLGQNNGESPGIPYVMEIWPAGNYSPVHNHGGANAVIRVLCGEIRANLYPFLSNSVEPFGHIDLKKGDITWISPTLNQVHKLENMNKSQKPCITIQTYLYDRSDIIHYDFFDYLDGDGNEKQFEPDSDMGFVEFRHIIKAEWQRRPRCMPLCFWA